MKATYQILTAASLLLTVQGCNKGFFDLDLAPRDQLTAASVFTSYDNCINYLWQCYNAFPNFETAMFDSEGDTDLGAMGVANSESLWIWQKIVVPTNSADYTRPFAQIRVVNLLLDNLDQAEMSEPDKQHIRSIAYFFKAYNYSNLVNKYGDITWVENALPDDDVETIFGPRTPRNTVSAKILELLEYAEAHIKPNGDGPNTVNVHVVRALLSRFGLREGTWRKYHGLPDANTYLNACVSASEKLIQAFPNIMSNYGDLFTSESLAGQDGIILFKQYEPGQLMNNISFYWRSAGGRLDPTKKAMDMYLLRDGQTRWTSPLFAGDDTPYKEFRNRDFRLYLTIVPPYQVVAPGSIYTYEHTSNPEHREYFPIMDSLSPDGSLSLPLRNWQGLVLRRVPHFRDNNGGQPFCVTSTGYFLTKFGSRRPEGVAGFTQSTDMPVFRIEEVMLNYAEAAKELGDFDQSICDLTINKLRARGGVAPLQLNSIPADPTRDPDVDPELWEIRRERAIELMAEGYRFDDLRRWKKMNYATDRKLGMWIVRAEENNLIPTLNNTAAGYVSYEGIPPLPYPEHYYLYPIPSNQAILTDGVLSQNPGW